MIRHLVATATAVALVATEAGCEEQAAPDLRPLDDVRAEAGERGVRWLVDHADAIPPAQQLVFFYRLNNVVTQPDLLARVRERLDEALARPLSDLDRDLPQLAVPPNPRLLANVLLEVWRRQLQGIAVETEREALRAWLAAHESTWWRKMPHVRQLLFVHRFERIGLAPRHDHEQVLASLRARVESVGAQTAIENSNLMFAVTHAILSRSDDFRRHVDPAGFEPEFALMRRAAVFYAENPAPAGFAGMLDLRAQLVSCRELARMPLDDVDRRTLRWVAGRQAADGSFESERGERGRPHATLVASRAMLRLDRPFLPERRASGDGSS